MTVVCMRCGRQGTHRICDRCFEAEQYVPDEFERESEWPEEGDTY